jgi:hypothetical protein
VERIKEENLTLKEENERLRKELVSSYVEASKAENTGRKRRALEGKIRRKGAK